MKQQPFAIYCEKFPLVGLAKRMVNQLGIATAVLESVLLPDR